MTVRLFLMGLVILGFGMTSEAAPTKKSHPKVRSVAIDGNTLFSEDRLRKLMATRSPGFLTSTEYHAALFHDDLSNIIAFYRQHGYLETFVSDTTVIRDTLENKVDIRFTIDEGAMTRVEGMSVFGNSVFADSILLERIALHKGDPFNPLAVERGSLAILQMYADTGYLDAKVSPDVKINTESHRVLVDIVVEEHTQVRIDSVVVSGLEMTNESVVRRELSFHPGDVVSYTELLQSQRRLYQTGLFESVFVRPKPQEASRPGFRTISVEVTEPMYGEFNVAVGYGSIEKARTRVELSHTNLAGTARQLGGRIEASFIKQGITGSFTEPRTFGSRWRTDINLLFELQQEPSYDLTRYGGRLTVGRSLSRSGELSFTYRYENTTLTKVEPVELPDDIKPHIRSLSVTLTNDTRDDPFDPHRGTLVDLSNELAGGFLQGTNSFARSELNVKKYWPKGRYTTFASAIRVGWQDAFGSSKDIPLNERFFAGGPSALRGFAYQTAGPLDIDGNPLGGKFVFVWNVIEVRRTVYKLLGAVAFLDIGNVYPAITDFSVGDIRSSAGPGLRAGTPIGILRLDWGFKLDPREGESRSQLYFSMGHAF
ncbi:outer membrane protein assembly factor BamA [bacterium]|nr:outer membrane protein assembly factor BamA [bacterium]